VSEGACLEVGDDLLDDGVTAVVGLSIDHRQRRVGEHRMVPPRREQLTLLIRDKVARVGVADAAHDQPAGGLLASRPGGERGEGTSATWASLSGVVVELGYGTTGLTIGQRVGSSKADSRLRAGQARGSLGVNQLGSVRRAGDRVPTETPERREVPKGV
jgi:hypothetical protein